jgi:NADPH-dependent ferric siderophore reductase
MTMDDQRLPGRRPPGRAWALTVKDAHQITPLMRRVTFTGDDLAEFVWKPGQDVVLRIPTDDPEPSRRHYTVRSFDLEARRLEIDFFLHGDTPGPRWAKAAKSGDPIGAQGPRGRTTLNPDAEWHLFTGDETCLPAVFAIVEQLRPDQRAFVFLEIGYEAERQTLKSQANVALEWIIRAGPPQPSSPALISRFADFVFPPGVGHAYVIGETSTVRAQRQGLIARGFPKDRISAEGYWRPGRVGGHDHNWE